MRGAVRLLVGLVVLAVAGLIVGVLFARGVEESPPTQPAPPATPQPPPSTTTTTQVKRTTTTTTRATASPEDCAATADVVSLFIGGVIELSDQLEVQLIVGDDIGAQDTYDTIDWVMRDWSEISNQVQEDCRGQMPALAAESKAAMEDMVAAWREVQGYCRQELAPLGFDC